MSGLLGGCVGCWLAVQLAGWLPSAPVIQLPYVGLQGRPMDSMNLCVCVRGWLVGWLAGWLAGWMDGWLDGWMAGWLASWMAG